MNKIQGGDNHLTYRFFTFMGMSLHTSLPYCVAGDADTEDRR